MSSILSRGPDHSTKGVDPNADSNQILPYDDLGYSRREHRSSTRRRSAAPIPLGRDLDRLVVLERIVLAVNGGRCPLSQLRHLPAELASPIQQSHSWSALHRWRIGRARILGEEEVRPEISISWRLILLWSVEDLVALSEAYEQRRAERSGANMTPDERERMAILCERIATEKDRAKFRSFVAQLNELLERKDQRLASKEEPK
jgi:hypothetical protein